MTLKVNIEDEFEDSKGLIRIHVGHLLLAKSETQL
jgi:hypothetical protein